MALRAMRATPNLTEARRKQLFLNPKARVCFALANVDAFLTIIFLFMPDGRDQGEGQRYAVLLVQKVVAYLTAIASCGAVVIIWMTYNVTLNDLDYERQLALWYVVALKLLQIFFDMILLGYPTFTRQAFVLIVTGVQFFQILWALRVVQSAREKMVRPLRPPLVIKALLDMKGDPKGLAGNAEPLTLGMLERLERLVKVRESSKFHVRHGRRAVELTAFTLLLFSTLLFAWEFAKIFSYQSRFFELEQLRNISASSNLPMYWPSRAHDPATCTTPLDGGPEACAPSERWQFMAGSMQQCHNCEMPRGTTNTRPKPMPTNNTRVVLVVLGGLSAESEYTKFLSFTQRPGWRDDAVQLMMRVQVPTHAVPNWLATVTGLTPDLVGALGNRNLGTTAVDNVFRTMRAFEDGWWCDRASQGCSSNQGPKPYTAGSAASPWFTGLVKTDLPYLVGDGSTSYVANEDETLDRSEVHAWSSGLEDEQRARVAHLALGEQDRPYHFFLLHLTDIDSQGARHGMSDFWNSHNTNDTGGTDPPWTETIPADVEGTQWRKNSYKRAVARKGDLVNSLMDKYADGETVFIVVGDHGHVNPGGTGGLTAQVKMVPLYAYKAGSGLGEKQRAARRRQGEIRADSARFVARARHIDESEAPSVTPNDKCDIMAESRGSAHINSCDGWRLNGEHAVENVDLAPTIMALLGLPVPRHATGVFIDDLMGTIDPQLELQTLVGASCSAAEEKAEAGAEERLRQDRVCSQSYVESPYTETPSQNGAISLWDESTFTRYRHVIHYRDLYQQKLAYVRGFLDANGRLSSWEGQDLDFLVTTRNGEQYYNEGADGRCYAYDPFNRVQEGENFDPQVAAHRYTLPPLDFGRCASCGAFEKRFLTGDEVTVKDLIVCQSNDWHMIKTYYVQGIKGLLTVYNREISYQMRVKGVRNHALTLALLISLYALLIYAAITTTLADPKQLVTKYRGEDYMKKYYARHDVQACLWALAAVALYYVATIVLFLIASNAMGYGAWDASIAYSPEAISVYVAICVLPAYACARLVRASYMYAFRHHEDEREISFRSGGGWLLFSPRRLSRLLSVVFAAHGRTSDIGMIYLIRIYLLLVNCLSAIILAVLHCSYSFIIPFIYRMVHVDDQNWSLRFQVITVHMLSFPLWFDSVWMFTSVNNMLVNSLSISQLYALRSSKEERRAGGFPPENEEETGLAAWRVPTGSSASTSLVVAQNSVSACASPAPGGGGGSEQPNARLLGTKPPANHKELQQQIEKLSNERTLFGHRIQQLEEELETLQEAKSNELADARLRNAFMGRGFSDLQVLLESGFKQLERFYTESGVQPPPNPTGQVSESLLAVQERRTTGGCKTALERALEGAGASGGAGANACTALGAFQPATGAAPAAGADAAGAVDGLRRSTNLAQAVPQAAAAASGDLVGDRMRHAIVETMSKLSSENQVAEQRKLAVLQALEALEGDGGADAALYSGDTGGTGGAEGEFRAGACLGAGGGGGGTGNDELDAEFMTSQGDRIVRKLAEAKVTKEELGRLSREYAQLNEQVSQLEREAVVNADEREKMNDDLAGVHAERDLLERKVNELRRELHSKQKEIEHLEAELKLKQSQQVRAMARLSVQKAKAEKQLGALGSQMHKLTEDKSALFKEVGSLELQLAQAHADREEARNWASMYRDMLTKVA